MYWLHAHIYDITDDNGGVHPSTYFESYETLEEAQERLEELQSCSHEPEWDDYQIVHGEVIADNTELDEEEQQKEIQEFDKWKNQI